MICINCVSPAPLKRLICLRGINQTCHYCGTDGVAVEPQVLFDYVLERAEKNTATQDDLSRDEDIVIFVGGSGDIATASIDEVLSDWMNLSQEPYYDDLYRYAPERFKLNDDNTKRLYFWDDGLLERNFYEEKWERFVADIRHSHRFFNPNASDFLGSVFAFLSDSGDVLKPAYIRIVAHGEPLYRARSASTYEDAKKIADDPANQLGPAPKEVASSQRMTPNGISALYCALERDTCLSEIQPIVGGIVVSIAFTPFDKLKFLNMTKLELIDPPELCLLDKGHLDALHLKTFVKTLVEKMSTPKGRNDELSYLSSQVVFEYLRLRFGDQVNGLILPSLQTGGQGTNVVLFPEFSGVSAKNYRKVPDNEIAETAELDFEPEEEGPFADGAKLYCVQDSLRFHKVKAVEIKAQEYQCIGELFLSDLKGERFGPLGA
jgi:RES domain/HEPN/RES N-terminal domain 1